jgi:hypothetical protein
MVAAGVERVGTGTVGVWPEPDTCVKETRFNGRMRSALVTTLAAALVAGALLAFEDLSARTPAGAAARTAVAQTATAAGKAAPALTVVDLNLLHGTFCPAATNMCDAPGRVELLGRYLEAARCPDVVGLEEISRPLYDLIKKRAKTLCNGDYQVVFGPPKGIDTELVLTKLPVTGQQVEKLVGGFRTASRVSLESDLGPVSLVVTHQDGDSDKGPVPCSNHCPPVCPSTTPVFECQTFAAAKLADGRNDKSSIRILMGDFNVPPASDRYLHLVQDGWLDAYDEAGNPECDPATGVGCTSGRDDKSLTSLQDPSNRETERIDFIFVKTPPACRPKFDTPTDANGNGIGTGLFAGQPNSSGPGGLAWPSDHIGVSMDMSCKARTRSGKKGK